MQDIMKDDLLKIIITTASCIFFYIRKSINTKK